MDVGHLKGVWDVTERVSVDVTLERYLMNRRDSVTSPSAFVDANVFTVGMRLWL